MMNSLPIARKLGTAAALTLALSLGACSATGEPANRSVNSIRQPVVERNNFTLDLAATQGGLSVPEKIRLADWFATLDLGYGDRVAIDDAMASPGVRSDVAALAGRHGILLSPDAPVTEGFVRPGEVRVVVTRATAHVPNCPNWDTGYESALGNAMSPGYGCAVNGNLAAMVADPEHLLEGAHGTGETTVMTSNRAIDSYRTRPPTGAGGLPGGGGTGN